MSANNMKVDLVLQDINTGQKFVLDRNEHMYKCGRGKENQILSQSLLVSREHCMFIRANAQLNVIDLGSSNGIYVNGVKQQPRIMTALKIDDVISLGCPGSLPDTARDPKSLTIYKLLPLEASNKRRRSIDSPDCNIPSKVPKTEVQTSTPDIIDISDESNEDIIVPKVTDNKSSNEKKIIEEPKVSPIKAETLETGANCKSKEVSRSLQENNSENTSAAGTSNCSSTPKRKKSEGSDRNGNPSYADKASTSDNSSGERRKSEEIDKKYYQKSPKIRKVDELQSSATVKEINLVKPAVLKEELAEEEKMMSGKSVPANVSLPKKLNSSKEPLKSSQLKKQVVPTRSNSGNTSSSLEKSRGLSDSKSKKASGCLKNVEESLDFLVPAFDMDEFNLHEQMGCDNYRRESGEPPANEPTIQRIKNGDTEQLIKYEPELNIVDDDVSVYNNKNDLTNVVTPTPIKLKRVKQEPKTKYSVLDVVVLSDDEDGVFPASQLFGDESDDEIKHTVKINDEDVEENDREMFEDRKNDFPDTIVLSDSDDDDNPWYDRLLRSQLLNESRLSLKNEIKKEEETEIVAFDEVEHMEEEEFFKEEEHFEENAQEFPIKDITEEIYDLCFANKDNKTKKSVSDKPHRKDEKYRAKGIEKKKDNEEPVCKATLVKQSSKDSEMAEKMSKNQKSIDNKIHKKKTSLEGEQITDEKRLPEEKRTSKKKRLTEDNKFLEEKRLSADKRLPEEKRVSVEKRPSIEKPPLPKQKSVEGAAENEKIDAGDIKQKTKSTNDAEKRRHFSEAKSVNISESSIDKPDVAEPNSNRTETSSDRLNLKATPVVMLSKLNNIRKSLQYVEPPFLIHGEGRGVSCSVKTIGKSSDKPETPVASTSGINDREKVPARKLTTKEKKELTVKSKIEERMQLQEQRFRRLKNKWAAECLPVTKKPASSSFTRKQREDIVSDRKEKLRQIAKQNKMTEELQPSSTRRIVGKPKAKVTANSRNDFLAKELEEQAKQTSVNSERMILENIDKNLEGVKGKDKSLELGTEASANRETSPLQEEKPSSGKKTKGKSKAAGNKDTAEENILHVHGYNISTEKKDKSRELANEIPMNGEIRQHSGMNSVKPISKKTKSSVILIDQSELPNKFLNKLSTQTATKASTMPNGSAQDFGEQTRRVGKTLANSTNAEESSRILQNSKIKIGKSEIPLLKENQEPKADKMPGRSRSRKRVSFDDKKTRIDFFEIDPGNSLKKCVSKDAPLLVKKLPRCSTVDTKACCPKLEQFLLHIFKWNPVWLEEQKQFNTAPPVVDEKKLVPLLSKYATYEDYYNVAEPLLALELWYGITRNCEVGKKNQQACFKFSIVNHSITLTTVPSTNVRVTTLMLEVVVSKRDAQLQAHPVYGDLVFFEYISNRKSKEGFQRWKVFAYVTNVRQTVITPLTHFNRDLLSFAKDPYILLTYTVMTKPLDHTNIQTNKVSRLRTISYLRSNIRMIQALQNLPVSPLCNTILYPKVEDYQLPSASNLDNYPLVTKDKLNAKQLEAVSRITDAAVQRLPKVCLIQGPPGTGKSKVIVNLVTQILYGNGRYQNNKKLRILLCAPSNAAIDEIVLRLLEIRKSFQKGNRFNMVRIGRTETMHPLVKVVSVTELAVKDVKKTADTYMSPSFTTDSIEEEKRSLQARINALELEKSNTITRQNPMHQKQIIRKLGDIQAKYNLLMNRRPADRLDARELARLQRAAENALLKGADVITCTLSSCYTNQMETTFSGNESISVCIVDEATQSAEAETLIPLMLGVRTLVLVGDTKQLPATVLSQKAKKFGLDQSLFARIQNAFEDQENNPIILLNTQYRMSYPVAYWPNRYFYSGALKNAAETYPFPFHCYKVLNLDSTQDEDKFSNTEEASFVANLIYTLMTRSKLDHLNAPVRIGVITPYNNQKQIVIKKLRERTAHVSDQIKKKMVYEVNTIDSFQGQERDVIIMSCVRSNGIGFLSDRQRLCVALTRAKHSLILCGNFRTFQRDPTWSALLSDAYDRGVYVRIKANAEIDEIKLHVVR